MQTRIERALADAVAFDLDQLNLRAGHRSPVLELIALNEHHRRMAKCGAETPVALLKIASKSIPRREEVFGVKIIGLLLQHALELVAGVGSAEQAMVLIAEPEPSRDEHARPRRLLDWAEAGRVAAGRLGVEMTVLAQPGHGVVEMAVWDSPDPRRLGQELVRPLRAAVEAEGGSLVLERAPIELKVSCEVWGSIHPEILSIMKRIKGEFDPDAVLSPGRFVGGL